MMAMVRPSAEGIFTVNRAEDELRKKYLIV